MTNKTLIPVIGIAIALTIGIIGAVKILKTPSNAEKKPVISLESPQQSQSAQVSNPAEPQTVSNTAPVAKNLNGCTRLFDQTKFNSYLAKADDKYVILEIKDYGTVKVLLDSKSAPKTVENFLRLTQAGFYDCLTFHRIAKDFVIQGGDAQGDGRGGPGYTLPAEIKLKHKRGAIAMARQGDEVNPKRESNGSQFYIALNDLPQLDGAYTVFGQVVSGMDVVDKIGSTQVQGGVSDGPPVVPVIIKKAIVSVK